MAGLLSLMSCADPAFMTDENCERCDFKPEDELPTSVSLANCTFGRIESPHVFCTRADNGEILGRNSGQFLEISIALKTSEVYTGYFKDIPSDGAASVDFPKDWKMGNFELQVNVQFTRDAYNSPPQPFMSFDLVFDGVCDEETCTIGGANDLSIAAPFELWTVGLAAGSEMEDITAEVATDYGEIPFNGEYFLWKLGRGVQEIKVPVFDPRQGVKINLPSHRGDSEQAKSDQWSTIMRPGTYIIKPDHTIRLSVPEDFEI